MTPPQAPVLPPPRATRAARAAGAAGAARAGFSASAASPADPARIAPHPDEGAARTAAGSTRAAGSALAAARADAVLVALAPVAALLAHRAAVNGHQGPAAAVLECCPEALPHLVDGAAAARAAGAVSACGVSSGAVSASGTSARAISARAVSSGTGAGLPAALEPWGLLAARRQGELDVQVMSVGWGRCTVCPWRWSTIRSTWCGSR